MYPYIKPCYNNIFNINASKILDVDQKHCFNLESRFTMRQKAPSKYDTDLPSLCKHSEIYPAFLIQKFLLP